MTLSMLRLYTVCYADWDAKNYKNVQGERNTKTGVRELNGQTVSEPGQFCRNVKGGLDLGHGDGRVGRRGQRRGASPVREGRPGSV